ncbi:nucleotidyltransferase family protein [Mucilaginibacter myungsuensis]|uniref:Nucleotidyltransferase family protein n=1 Tax=Mucilaginibacter myungsuensis TaxID=649104 RepID=A0A929PWY3_9SPHI|nr:nucleotidyltransferase family protein [Mucilaginibacter myungsuensis]MBE9662614.1 nucleotidyltransferase family protein [Mucilaginibacter myungsuensis]MDN3598034.1 nucleotidyltransferase family protein [Mucilaginibacter myungsuensis]
MDNNIGIIILAAGSSSRMGEPKQFLQYKGKSLLRHAVETASAIRRKGPIIVVTGALHDELFKECAGLQVGVAHNTNWQTGISSSIHTGLRALARSYPDVKGALVLLCDQPLITSAHLDNLTDIFAHKGYQSIVATSFADTVGSPAIFGREMFERIYQLKGDKGARQILLEPDVKLATVPFKPAAIDIDTKEDYEGLK